MVGIEGIKNGQPHSLITKDHFAEMIRFENWLFHELEVPVPRPNATFPHRSFHSFCNRNLNLTDENKPKKQLEQERKCKDGDPSYCFTYDNRCVVKPKPIDFIWNPRLGDYELDKYKTDEELILKV